MTVDFSSRGLLEPVPVEFLGEEGARVGVELVSSTLLDLEFEVAADEGSMGMGAPNWTGILGDDILCEMVVCGAGWISLCVSIWSGITREAREVDDVMALYCICITPARFEEDRRRFDFDPSLAPCPALPPAPLPWPLSSPSRHPIARQPRRRRRRKKLQRRRPSIQRNQKSFSPRVTLGHRRDWIGLIIRTVRENTVKPLPATRRVIKHTRTQRTVRENTVNTQHAHSSFGVDGLRATKRSSAASAASSQLRRRHGRFLNLDRRLTAQHARMHPWNDPDLHDTRHELDLEALVGNLEMGTNTDTRASSIREDIRKIESMIFMHQDYEPSHT